MTSKVFLDLQDHFGCYWIAFVISGGMLEEFWKVWKWILKILPQGFYSDFCQGLNGVCRLVYQAFIWNPVRTVKGFDATTAKILSFWNVQNPKWVNRICEISVGIPWGVSVRIWYWNLWGLCVDSMREFLCGTLQGQGYSQGVWYWNYVVGHKENQSVAIQCL